jgi:hypothetical protein
VPPVSNVDSESQRRITQRALYSIAAHRDIPDVLFFCTRPSDPDWTAYPALVRLNLPSFISKSTNAGAPIRAEVGSGTYSAPPDRRS